MKTKITVDIHKSGTLNDAIIRMVTNHNEGKVNVDESLIRLRCHCYFAEWVAISPKFSMTGNSERLDISENDKPTLTLSWKYIHELDKSVMDIAAEVYPDTETIPYL